MAYSLPSGLFVENGPAVLAAKAAEALPAVRFLPWRKLDPEHRLQAIENAMKLAANDAADGLPLAL